MKLDLINPEEISKRSFEIIEETLKPNLPDKTIRSIVYRVIHSTADFDYSKILEFKNNPVESFNLNAPKKLNIYSDTQMIIAGTNKNALMRLNGTIDNYSHDNEVIYEAKQKGITRAIIGINKAYNSNNFNIYVIGNSPTALNELIELINTNPKKIDLIIGCPVGFVGAKEAKENLNNLDKFNIPYIRTSGNKGGSTVAIAILNALLYQMIENEK